MLQSFAVPYYTTVINTVVNKTKANWRTQRQTQNIKA